ncbi:MAG: DUF4396 domain-containing protein [Acidobacteriota bacterium]|nr:DUF4396 domain-containing protein [Acidobacteriota bacterium]
MPPTWLSDLSWAALALAGVCAVWIAGDQWLSGHRQQMAVMEAVWPVTALYFGPLAVWAYRSFGRPKSPQWRAEHGYDEPPERPSWTAVATGVSHCGAGCTLGDLAAEWAVFGAGASIAGLALLPEYIGDYLLALAFGIAFQYFAIAPMRGLGLRKGLVEAAKADFLSLSSFEIGLFGWMALTQLVFFPHHLRPDQPTYWFFMQVGMIVGFFTAYPTNVWLIRRGIKEAM